MPVIADFSAVIAEAARIRRFAGDLETVRKRTVGTLTRRLPVIARRDIQEEYHLPAARITAGLMTRSAGNAVELTGSKRGIGFVAYGARASRKNGVMVTLLHAKGSDRWPDAFIATGRGGNVQAFVRKGHARLPIKTLYGSSIATALRKPDRQQRITDAAQDVLRGEIDRLTRAR